MRSTHYQLDHTPLDLPVQRGVIYLVDKTPHKNKVYSLHTKKKLAPSKQPTTLIVQKFSTPGNFLFFKLPDWLLRWSLKNGSQQPRPICCGRFWAQQSLSDSSGFSGRGGPFLLGHCTCGIEKGDVWCQKNAYIEVGLNLNLSLHSIYVYIFFGGGEVNYI